MPIPNFGVVTPDLFRSGQPDERGFKDLALLGVKYIIKLNDDGTPSEYELGPKYGLQVDGYPLMTFLNLADTIIRVAGFLDQKVALGTTLVHCTKGRDRTGLVVGAWRIIRQGWTVEQVDAERAEFGVTGYVELLDSQMEDVLREIYAKVHP